MISSYRGEHWTITSIGIPHYLTAVLSFWKMFLALLGCSFDFFTDCTTTSRLFRKMGLNRIMLGGSSDPATLHKTLTIWQTMIESAKVNKFYSSCSCAIWFVNIDRVFILRCFVSEEYPKTATALSRLFYPIRRRILLSKFSCSLLSANHSKNAEAVSSTKHCQEIFVSCYTSRQSFCQTLD
jgi:hypothetical protein